MRTHIAGGLFVLPDKPAKTGLKPYNERTCIRKAITSSRLDCFPDAGSYFLPRNRLRLGARKPGNELIALTMHQVHQKNCLGSG